MQSSLDVFDRLTPVTLKGLSTEDLDPRLDGNRIKIETPADVLDISGLGLDEQRVVDITQALIINTLPKVFTPGNGPLWVDIRVHRGGETEEEEENETRPIIGIWVLDERVLKAKGDPGPALLFVDRWGVEHALQEMIEWLEAPPAVATSGVEVVSVEEAAELMQKAHRRHRIVVPVGMSMPTDDTTMAIIHDDRMELLVGDAHSDTVTVVDLPAFGRHLLNNMERELLLGEKAAEVYPR